MFKFSFAVDQDTNSAFKTEADDPCGERIPEGYECSAVLPTQTHLDSVREWESGSQIFSAGSLGISYVTPALFKKLPEHVDDCKIRQAEKDHTDLIPGVYEGGAKIWECTKDLVNYLDKQCISNAMQEKNVLDLGCGAGILGVYALKLNAATVHFQDYNEDVLDNVTIPTVLLNFPCRTMSALLDKVKFYSGDWSNYIEATRNSEKFDIILSSETIYNPASYQKLLDVFEEKLKPGGIVLLAAKVYYFGVGGGLRQFEQLVDSDQRFRYETVWTSGIGVSREILKLNRK